MKKERIILGIDPGTNIMGYGLICQKGNNISLIDMDVIKMNKADNHFLKLKNIFESTLEIIDKYNPDEMSIEAPFFGKNVQSMLKLGRAQGVAMAAGLFRSIPIFEYSPKKIKQSVTGSGNSSKEQVLGMTMKILKIKDAPKYLDATDAVAAAICHFYQRNNSIGGSSYSGWGAFLKDNPGRIKKKH